MKALDLDGVEIGWDRDDPAGLHVGRGQPGSQLGALALGGSPYELPLGQSSCPCHDRDGTRACVLVLAGEVAARHPGGSGRLRAGAVACFPDGPPGARRLSAEWSEPARMLVIATVREPGVAVCPDSVQGAGGEPDPLVVRRSSGAGDRDGEV